FQNSLVSGIYSLNAIRIELAHSNEYIVGTTSVDARDFTCNAKKPTLPFLTRLFGLYFIPIYVSLIAGVMLFTIINFRKQKVIKQLQKHDPKTSSYTFDLDTE
ncbi:MAG: hypothetical protein ACFFDW_13180, partial [Candidatus Thorarchaeota archaeon]